ncbi:MAG: oxygen-dependent coproporphyrinogen oxidase [Deltaproteobacteria bacterium]|nr:oxygen-dependent coproporphyrinogen oxidase [Deltaproteobacteria bacterium]
MSDLFDRAAKFFHELQTDICRSLAELDAAKDFGADAWQRPGGGGGVARVLEGGAVFEKAGVNWSNVEGDLPADLASHMPGTGTSFRAAGVSLVLHPRSPMVPTAHANFRCIAKGDTIWFGGGADLTPYYFHREDAVHFHQTLAGACDRHKPVGDYDRFKAWCDEYFFLPHRQETRGVGGVFFDYLGAKGEHAPEQVFAFVQDIGRAFVPAYRPIAERRNVEPYGETERTWQLRRRGRYVEFNLLYDRGTIFGLKTNGRIESILMSLPPLTRWDYDISPQPGSPEAELLTQLRATNWLGR